MNRINATRFMTQEEMLERLTEFDLQNPEQNQRGGVPLLVKGNKAYVDAEDSHTIVFGATGSKKTRLFGMPTVEILSRAGESFVVTDPKGEIYEKTVDNVRKQGYQIYCLNLRDFKKGIAWNPLTLPYDFYQRGEKSKAIEMVSELARMLSGMDLQEPYWSITAKDVITGLIMILLESAGRNECNIKSMLSLWEQYMSNKEGMLEAVKQLYGDTVITRKLRSLNNESNKTVGSIEAILATSLNRISENEEFVEFLSQEGMEFGEVTQGKTAIYLIVPDENKFYHFIAALFLEQLYEVLIKAAQNSPQLRLPIRMNYIVDEFANIPKMENMDSMITASRSRNIRFNLLVQSKMQLEEKYGSVASVICDNCNNWIYLYSKDCGLLSEISKLCGEVIYDNHMVMPLISEFELQHLKKEEGEALILTGRNYPCIVNLADIDEYPQAEERRENERQVLQQKWCQANVFRLGKPSHKDIYKCTAPREKRNNVLMPSAFMKTRWLVGTCNGMILYEDMISRNEAESGMGILKCCFDNFDNIKDAVDIKWYTACSETRRKYKERLESEPEKVFLTIDEVGRKEFDAVNENVITKIKGVCSW